MNIPQGITIIYFNDESRNIYAKIPPDKEIIQRLSKRVFRDAMTALSTKNSSLPLLCGD